MLYFPLIGNAAFLLVVLLSLVLHSYGEGLRGLDLGDSFLYHNHQSKLILIPLRNLPFNLTDLRTLKPLLHPTPPDAWEVSAADGDPRDQQHLTLRLKEGRSWLPGRYGFRKTKKYPLRWYGMIQKGVTTSFAAPITIAYIVADIDDLVCDDSCEGAFDGVCTDIEMLPYLFATDDDRERVLCAEGTDCTDCGGVEEAGRAVECSDTCGSANDEVCDDIRGTGRCRTGTDCADCGPYRSAHVSSGYALQPPVNGLSTQLLNPSQLNTGALLWALPLVVVLLMLYHALCRAAPYSAV